MEEFWGLSQVKSYQNHQSLKKDLVFMGVKRRKYLKQTNLVSLTKCNKKKVHTVPSKLSLSQSAPAQGEESAEQQGVRTGTSSYCVARFKDKSPSSFRVTPLPISLWLVTIEVAEVGRRKKSWTTERQRQRKQLSMHNKSFCDKEEERIREGNHSNDGVSWMWGENKPVCFP